MKVGLLGDIHANLEALNTCLELLVNQEHCDYVMATGDIVGYGPQPCECIERLMDLEIPSALGNHDEYSMQATETLSINSNARFVIDWTRKRLKPQHLEYLNSLPDVIDAGEFSVTHSSNCFSPRWTYVVNKSTAELNFRFQNKKVSFNGHTHLPMIISLDNNGTILLEDLESKTLDRDKKYLINVGSVGQPRDRNSAASTVTFDTESYELKYIRVDYDISKTQKLMKEYDFPEFLINRLELGQ